MTRTWAVVAGASEGLGEAFAEALAARGHDLILLARRESVLTEVAKKLHEKHGVEVRPLACDLADAGFATALMDATKDLDVRLAVYNAAYSPMGPLLDRPIEDALRAVDVNCRGPLRFVYALAPAMVARGRGGIVLMASLAGFQGVPTIATYAASKAFNIVLGEGLWAELKPKGVDVIVSCVGAVRTPGYLRTMTRDAPGTLAPAFVAEQSLKALGHGPHVSPGAVNKLARFFMGRLLSRRRAVSIMGAATIKAARQSSLPT